MAVMKNISQRLLWKSDIFEYIILPVWKMCSILQPEVRKDATAYQCSKNQD